MCDNDKLNQMILNNKYIENNTEFKSDICIIGSGMSAQLLASTLKNKKIIIVESGKIGLDNKIQELNSFKEEGLKFRDNYKNRIRQLGGSANLWANQLMTLSSDEVDNRKWIVDDFSWPTTYDKLVGYYERVINLIYKKNFQPEDFFLDFNQKYKSKIEDHLLSDGTFSFNDHFWPSKVQNFNLNSKFTKNLLMSKNIEFLENFTCTNLYFDEKIKNVKNIDIQSNNKSCKIFSKIFILACGALENARIILNNAEKNKILVNKNTGRYFMDHPRQTLGTLRLKKNYNLNSLYGIKKFKNSFRRSLQLSSNLKIENKLLNSYCFLEPSFSDEDLLFFDDIINDIKNLLKLSRFPRINFKKFNINKIFQLIYFILPPQSSNSILNNLIYNYLNLIKPKLIFKELNLQYQSEQFPNYDSRIYLGKDLDIYNQKKLIIDWKLDSSDYRTSEFFLKTFKNKFVSSRYFLFNESQNKEIMDASHHSGTTRMSHHRDDGVIDLNNKFHDLDNLFISGSSAFRISGSSNPGLTNMAMSLRLGDHINNNLL